MADNTSPSPSGTTTAVKGPSADASASADKGSLTSATGSQTKFKVLDVRENDVTLELDDGRVIAATAGDGIKLDDIKRGSIVNITHDGIDASDAPKGAVVSKVLPKE